MPLVNVETGEILDRPTYSEVRESIASAREAGAKFFEQIVWQVERRAWEVLGHESWDAMREAEYADMGVVVPRADRPEIVTRMRKVGLTQQEIADTLGVSEATVRTDLNRNPAVDLPEVVETSRGTRPTSYSKPSTEVPAKVSDVPTPAECGRPEPTMPAAVDLTAFIEADDAVRSARWQSSFMAAIARSGELMLFTPDDVAGKADAQILSELERLSTDLSNYVSRVRVLRPHRLTAIKGGIQ